VIEKRVVIKNEHGLHARPAAAFVKLAEQYESSIELAREDRQWVNGKSVLGILSLAVEPGQTLIIRIDGKGNRAEEQRAFERLKTILEEDL
jgi:phosphotransferase system HPr (HPr) family protein